MHRSRSAPLHYTFPSNFVKSFFASRLACFCLHNCLECNLSVNITIKNCLSRSPLLLFMALICLNITVLAIFMCTSFLTLCNFIWKIARYWVHMFRPLSEAPRQDSKIYFHCYLHIFGRNMQKQIVNNFLLKICFPNTIVYYPNHDPSKLYHFWLQVINLKLYIYCFSLYNALLFLQASSHVPHRIWWQKMRLAVWQQN